VWIRQQFGRIVPGGLRLDEGFPLPVRNGRARREAYVPEALTSLLVRGLAEIRPGSDAMGRYFFTIPGLTYLRRAFDEPNGLDRNRCPDLFAALEQRKPDGPTTDNHPPVKTGS